MSTLLKSTVLAIATVLLLPSGAAAAQSFEARFNAYLTEMRQIAVTVESTARGRAAYAQLGIDPVAGIDRARREVAGMSASELAVLRRAFSAMPDWADQPDVLEGTVRRNGLKSRRRFDVPPTCDPGPGTPLGITDYYIAAGVALGLEATHVAIPDDVLTAPAQIAAGIAWGVAAGVALTLEGLNAVEAECLDAKLEDFTRTRLDVNVSTRASQASFNTFTANFDVLSSLINSRLDVAVSTRASQVSLDVVHNKLDSIAISIGDQGTLALRIEIESDLSESGSPMALFMLPAASGGHLELVREIVADTIAKMKALGEKVKEAEYELAKGDKAFARGDFKEAYGWYAKAYRSAAEDGHHDDHDDDDHGDDD